MIKVSPYIQTVGNESFKEFLNTPFTLDMLYPIYGEKSCETLFDGWREKNMLTWNRFTNDDKIILEFYPNYYIVKKDVANAANYRLSLPNTINEFINDMNRFGIQLYWTDFIDEIFEPQDYLHVDEIKPYYVRLLDKLGKSNELI